MEIPTLIKWNSLAYILYYGLNFAFDYFRFRTHQPGESITYSYKDLLKEAPRKVSLPKAHQQSGKSVAREIKEQKTQTATKSPVTLDAPVEDQGMPMEEFMEVSKSFSVNINF